MTGFDIGVIVFIVFSALFAFARGFVKEVLSIVAWFGASVAALYAYPYLRPIAGRMTSNPQFGDAGAALIAFIVALVILSIITSMVAKRVKDSPAGGIDRSLGLVFGILRGGLLACLVYIALAAVLPALGTLPNWWTESRTRPLLATGVTALRELAPRPPHSPSGPGGPSVEEQLNEALKALRAPRQDKTPAGTPAYAPEDQRNLDRLFQQNQVH